MTLYPPAPQAAQSASSPQRPSIPEDWPAADPLLEKDADGEPAAIPGLRRWPGLRAQAGIGAAIGIGSAALVAALLYARPRASVADDPAPARHGRTRKAPGAKN